MLESFIFAIGLVVGYVIAKIKDGGNGSDSDPLFTKDYWGNPCIKEGKG